MAFSLRCLLGPVILLMFFMVSRRVFDIKTRPMPSNKIAKDASFALKSIKIERNLDTNIYGPKAI